MVLKEEFKRELKKGSKEPLAYFRERAEERLAAQEKSSLFQVSKKDNA